MHHEADCQLGSRSGNHRAVIAPAPARAVVYATEPTQIMVLMKEIETVVNTVKQLEYQARMLSSLSMNSSGDVVRSMQQVRAMMGVLNPAIESINASDDLFRRCWPEEYERGISQRDLAGKVQDWRRVSEATMQESWRVEAAAVAEQEASARRVGNLVAASQAAPGQTAAIRPATSYWPACRAKSPTCNRPPWLTSAQSRASWLPRPTTWTASAPSEMT